MIPRHLMIAVGILLLAVLGMGIYAARMRGRAAQTAPTTSDTRPLAPPVSGPTEQVTLYVAVDDTGTLRVQQASIPLPSTRQQRAESILRTLLEIYLSRNSSHPLGPGADIHAVYLVSPGLAVIDLNSAFANGHRSGVLEEELTVTSMIQTLAVNLPDIVHVKILVDGHDRETLAGHADLSGVYEVSAVAQVTAQMQ